VLPFNFYLIRRNTGNKFGAKKVIVNGIKFDSIKEGEYYKQLLLQRKAIDRTKRVIDIELQPPYKVEVEGKHICNYKADFKVLFADGHTEVIDVKGYKKGCAYEYFKLKKKLVEALYNIKIIEK
jgi:hypothetical protein